MYKINKMNCQNNLDIYGEYEDLVLFFEENRVKKSLGKKLGDENILTFQKVLPVLEGEDKKKIWGTSEDALIKDFERDILVEETEQMYYEFLTVGNPPNLWLKEVGKKYSNLEFNLVYYNSEFDVKGEIIYREGELYYSYRSSLESEIWEMIGEDAYLDIKKKLKKDFVSKSFLEKIQDENSEECIFIKKVLEEYDENGLLLFEKIRNHLMQEICYCEMKEEE